MGWGEARVPEGPRLSPSATAAVLGLAAAARREQKHPTTGNRELVAEALNRFDREVRL